MEIKIGELIEIARESKGEAVFCILNSLETKPVKTKRLQVSEVAHIRLQDQENLQWAIARDLCNDSPIHYHPKFVMALLSTLSARTLNSLDAHFLEWKFPAIAFETTQETRRSMTLNGMRMSTEFFASGSPRILQFVDQRLQAGQSDVIHDVVVYLMQRVLQMQALSDEERMLQAESLAAYLGLKAERVLEWFFEWEIEGALKTDELSLRIENEFAVAPRRNVDIAALVENQMQRFEASMRELKQQEERVLVLMDEVVMRFYQDASRDSPT